MDGDSQLRVEVEGDDRPWARVGLPLPPAPRSPPCHCLGGLATLMMPQALGVSQACADAKSQAI